MAAIVESRRTARTALSRAGWCGVLAGPLFVSTAVLLTLAEYGFLKGAGWSVFGDNRIPYPSYTALGRFGFVQVANFFVTGALVLAFVTALGAHLHGWRGGTARVLLTLTALAMCTSAFRTDPVPGPMSWHGLVHALSFVVVVATSVFGLVFAGLALRREPGWRRWGTATALLGPWQALTFTVGGGLLPGDTAFYVFLLTLFGWIGLTGRRVATADPARA